MLSSKSEKIIITLFLLGVCLGVYVSAGFADSGPAVALGRAKGEVRVLDPVGVLAMNEASFPPATRFGGFSGKKVWIVVVDYGSTLMPAVTKVLPEYAPGVLVELKDASKVNPFFMLKPANRPDAAIVGNGVCEGTTLNAANYAKQAEKIGIPAVVSFHSDVYYGHQEAMHKLEFPGVRAYATRLPDPERKEDPEQLARLLIPQLIEGLTRPVGGDRPRICFTGTEEKAKAYFNELRWTGEMSVILPTEERVAALLKGTSHKSTEVVGVMAPSMRQVTVEKVAIQAVMAGCSPKQMPLALTLADLLCRKKVAEEFGKRRPPILQIVVTGPTVETTGVPGYPGADSIEKLARLMLIHLGGIASPVMKAKRLLATLNEQGKTEESTVTIIDVDRAEIWQQSTATFGKWL